MTTEEFEKWGMVKNPDGTFSKVSAVKNSAKQNILSRKQATGRQERKSSYDLISHCIRIDLKPLSVNDAYTGKRYSTEEKRIFNRQCDILLPNNYKIPEPPFQIYFKFGFSSKASDYDGPIKVVQDSIAKKYKFNDKLIRRAIIDTEYVKKGKEYFEFKIETYLP